MNITLRSLTLAFSLFLILLSTNPVDSKVDPKEKLKLRLKKPEILDIVSVGYNRWNYVMRNNGSLMFDSHGNSNEAGGEFPRGTGTTMIFAAGAWFGTMKQGIPVVSETQFTSEFQPGRIVNSGVPFENLIAEDPSSNQNQVFLIDQTRSGSDYDKWPAEAIRDESGNPGLVADAQTWAVFNDLGSISPEDPDTNHGLGLQITLESFAFQTSLWSDAVLLKYTIENKSDNLYEHSYFGFWAETDVDVLTNDVLGSDSTRGLGYSYNFDNQDKPLSVGIDILQGPVATLSEMGPLFWSKFQHQNKKLKYDPAANRFILEQVPGGKALLSATVNATYLNGQDPPTNNHRYNLLQGVETTNDPPLLHGGWVYPGNPVTNIGIIDNSPSDKRFLLSTGPFTMSPGIPQEVWVAVIGAEGTDNIDAVSKLFTVNDHIQASFDNGLLMPEPPSPPVVSISALDGKVVLSWQDNAEYAVDTYGLKVGINIANGYSVSYDSSDFQGYRVYKSLTGLEGSFEKIAQFDKIDGYTRALYYGYDQNGNWSITTVEVGTDNGLRHEFIDDDVRNLTKYYYSVTAYDAQPTILLLSFEIDDPLFGLIPAPTNIPISLESKPASVSAMPARLSADFDDTATLSSTAAVKTVGFSEGNIQLEIIDPSKVVTADYEVEFFKLPLYAFGGVVRDSTLLPQDRLAYQFKIDGVIQRIDSRADDPRTYYDRNGNSTFDAGVDSLFHEGYFGTQILMPADSLTGTGVSLKGLRVKVISPVPGAKKFLCVSNATGPLNPPDMAAFAFNRSGFPTLDGLPPNGFNDRPQIPNLSPVPNYELMPGGFWGFHVGGGQPSDYESFISRVFRNDNFSRFIPNDFEMRFTAEGGQAHFAFTTGVLASVPFELWNIGIETPGDTTDDYRMIPWLFDADGDSLFGLTPIDHPISGGDNDPMTDWIYWMDPANRRPGSLDYEIWVSCGIPEGCVNLSEVMGRMVLVNWNGGSVSDSNWPANVNQLMPATGTVFRLISAKPMVAGDVYTFSSAGYNKVTSSDERHRLLNSVRVVPNPFYGLSQFQAGSPSQIVKFTNLPGTCSIKIFNVAGDLVKTLYHNSSSNNDRPDIGDDSPDLSTSTESWDLRTETNRYVAAGIYIALVEAKGFGKKMVKFAIIR